MRRGWVAAAVAGVVVVGAGAAVIVRQSSSGDGGSSVPRFVDDTASSGVDHQYDGGFEYFVGGGVAAFDCDDDGFQDLYLAGGTAPAALYRNTSTQGGALTFEQVPDATADSNGGPVTDLTAVTGAYPIDIDSDGEPDLVVLRNGEPNEVLRGLGDCRFEHANDALGIDGGSAWTAAFSATWEGDAALPTLAFGNYLVPGTKDCDASELVRPTEAGDRYDTPLPLAPGYCTLSVLFSDWNRTGQRDLRMANDRHYYLDGSDQLWRITPGEPPSLYTEADGWQKLKIWGMGIASQDLTGDGKPEYFVTSQADNKLQTLDPDANGPSFSDIALARGVTAQRPYTGGDVLPSTAWHPEFADVNNDGRPDLFITKGNVEATVDYATKDPNNLMIQQADGTFVEGAEQAGIVAYEKSRGAAAVDLNLDGLLDLVVVHREAPVTLWRNTGSGDADGSKPMGHWLMVQLQQPAPNVDAIGAWVDVRTDAGVQQHEVTIGGGHASGDLGWIHFGLGDATTAEVRVHWPDGEVGEWMPVDADTFVLIDRDAGAPQTITPGAAA